MVPQAALLQGKIEIHLLDERCLWLITTDGRVTTDNRMDEIVIQVYHLK